MIALKDTAQPLIYEVRNQGPPQSLTTQSRYGQIFIGSSHESHFKFAELTAGTSYVVYAYVEDRGGNVSGEPGMIEFTTADKPRAAEVELVFNQLILSDAEKEISMRALAFKLSIPIRNVIEKKFNVISKTLYQTSSNRLPLIIIPLYDNPNFPDMVVRSNMVNDPEVKNYIKSKMSTFDATITYTVTSYPSYTPFFIQTPDLISDTKTSLNFQASLSNYGFIYAVIKKKGIEDTTQSNSYQIWKGYDGGNLEIDSLRIEVTQPGFLYEFSFDLLTPSTLYEVFMTAGSNHPDFPDLLGDGAIVSVESITRDASEDDDLLTGGILKISLLLIACSLSIVVLF